MSDEQQTHAAPYSIEYQGKSIVLRLVDQDVKAAYSAARKSEAFAELSELRGAVDELMYRDMADSLNRRITAGEFKFHSADTAASFTTLEGVLRLLKIISNCPATRGWERDDWEKFIVAKKDELDLKLRRLVDDSVPDPKAGPAGTPG